MAVGNEDHGCVTVTMAAALAHGYCALMPALTITSCHFLRSAAMRAANASGDVGSGSTPIFASASTTSPWRKTRFISMLRRCKIGAGVAAGAMIPCQNKVS